ncbi:MAG: FAD-binding protein [Candidatus Lokiarchaeota archaeon]|nr:FAD-binding protein [Candidatus Lokiarchaeota archaeon]
MSETAAILIFYSFYWILYNSINVLYRASYPIDNTTVDFLRYLVTLIFRTYSVCKVVLEYWTMTNRIEAISPESADLSEVKVIEDQAEIMDTYALYLDDESHSFDGKAEKLLFPSTEAQVASILKEAHQNGTAVTIQGGRTGLTGAAVPLGGIALNLERMNDLLYMNYSEAEDRYSIAAESGVLLEDLVDAVSKKNLDSLKDKESGEHQAALERFLAESVDMTFPVDPTEMSAWIGGITACNASGARTFHYGAVRDWVYRIRVVLANGDILDIERGKCKAKNGKFEIVHSDGSVVEIQIPSYQMPETKNAAGIFAKPDMDLIDLFIGSEGILGVITMVELGLVALPENIMTVMAFFPSEDDAVGFVYDIRAEDTPVQMDFLEYFGPNALKMIREKASSAGIRIPALSDDTQAIVFFEFAYTEETMEEKIMGLEMILNKHNSSSESSWAGLDRSELEKMKTVRHFVPETVNGLIASRKQKYHEVHKIGTDMAVPDKAFREYLKYYRDILEEQGMEYVIFGHIGDNHVHVNMIPRNNEEVKQGMDNYMIFAKRAVELGGTVAAEHGIGKLKRDFLTVMYGQKGIQEMQEVKRALDPNWIINPGNMIPNPVN